MNMALLPFGRRGVPAPFIITPLTREEAMGGKATLIAVEDLPDIIDALTSYIPERIDLISKFSEMR